MSEKNDKPDFKSTLNLPKTDFPMKADLPNKEPQWVKFWSETGIYPKVLKKNESRPKFVLHDGPPYANGRIHHGHVLNKILKDFIVKFKNLSGSFSDYVPGWDCHGLPIEHQVDKDLGPKKKEMSKGEIRRACREYAQKFVDIQREEFRRLGILAHWDEPYLTMSYGYEAATLRQLGKFVALGSVYRGRKPVHWCTHCQTALAEAEVEYEDHESPSVYVKFAVKSDWAPVAPVLKDKKVFFVIWTTTPWTLPANVAIALHKSYTYAAIEAGDEVYIVAEGLLDAVRGALDLNDAKLLDRIPSKKLENFICQHPFLNRESRVVLSDHVTLEQGTGCVHIAPGHGQEDYEVGLHYQLPVINPVDHEGKFTEEVGVTEWVGLHVFKANPLIVDRLKEKGALLKVEVTKHSYPHCWRCKNPVIFRSTPQWFISLQHADLRNRSLDAIRRTQWVPYWGRERIYGMVENRPDWCISRQRTWGVPITAFRCVSCRESWLDAKLIDKVADRFEKEGADAWFNHDVQELLPSGAQCPKCGAKEFEKENDILDVWFDSGVSFAAVLEKNSRLAFPADVYLEGSDQHRGWFHSSLLVAVGTQGQAPYKTVLTHGFVVDGQGRKYSKSAKNYVPAETVLKKMGAEILRLWVAAEDYRNDIRFSDEILSRLTETYRKIRNTCRYLLGNLYDFNPEKDRVPYDRLLELDRWALNAFARLTEKLEKAYNTFEFHQIYHALNQFCTVDLSSFYLDILKDRLYTSSPQSLERRAAQTVLFELARGLSLWMAPILSFTAEEVWRHLPDFPGKTESLFLSELLRPEAQWLDEPLEKRIDQVRQVREEVLKALEIARQGKVIGSSLEAQVRVTAEDELMKLLKEYEKEWPTILIVSQVVVAFEVEKPTYESPVVEGLRVQILPAEGKKCERCWNYTITVGRNEKHPLLCERCSKVVG
ncbi:MAG: isoleucine--tRNA ligase [bacterium]